MSHATATDASDIRVQTKMMTVLYGARSHNLCCTTETRQSRAECQLQYATLFFSASIFA